MCLPQSAAVRAAAFHAGVSSLRPAWLRPSRAAAESAAVPAAAAGSKNRRVLISQLSCHHRLYTSTHPPPNSHIGPFTWLTRTGSFPGIGDNGRVKGDFSACSLQPWTNYFLCNSPWCGFYHPHMPSDYKARPGSPCPCLKG